MHTFYAIEGKIQQFCQEYNVINQNVPRSYKFQKSYQLSSYRYYFSTYFTDSEYFIRYIFSIFTSVFSLFYFLLTHPSYPSFEIAFCIVSSYPVNSSLCSLAGYGIGTWDQQIRDYTIKENVFPFFLQLSNVNSF